MTGTAFTCFWCVSVRWARAGREPNWIKAWNGFLMKDWEKNYQYLSASLEILHIFWRTVAVSPAESLNALSGMIRLEEADWLSNVSSVLTLQRRKPPQSFAGGCWGSASCSRRRRGKSCAPGRKRPCHYSSWMRNSEYPHAEKKSGHKMEAAISYGNVPKVGVYD